MSNSEEEEIARDYICFENANATVVIVDATCLERNLNLVYQIMELTRNVIVCVNLLDEAKKKGITIDLDLLSNSLGVPVVGTIARKPKTLKKLMSTIKKVCLNECVYSSNYIKYVPCIEDSISMLFSTVSDLLPYDKEYLTRWICIKLIENNSELISSIEKNLDISLQNNSKINLKLIQIQSILKNNDITENNIHDNIISSILFMCEIVSNDVCHFSNTNYHEKDRKIDKILTSKKLGIPIMLVFLGIIFWLTITGANYPSQLLSNLFGFLKEKLILFFNFIGIPVLIKSILIDGVYTTVTWIISVMLPPMAIFFPLFTLLEDSGFLPRLAFNLDNCFKKACSSGKQALTMCMGFGCNAAGVVGCRIIESPREKLTAILTNNFVPCNGRFPILITISSVFIASLFKGFTGSIISTIIVLVIILFGIFITLLISKFLSKTMLKGLPSSFMLELPPYRKPQIGKVIIRSIFDRTLFVLARAIKIAIPAGIIIWLFSNISIGSNGILFCSSDGISLLTYVANFLDPFAKFIGFDGYILTAFILGLPANEIILPILLMSYLRTNTLVDIDNIFNLGDILIQNGWTVLTAINVMIFTLLHFPCSTTLITIFKETNSKKWTLISFLLPTLCGILVCFFTTLIWNLFLV